MPSYFDNVEGLPHEDLKIEFELFGKHYCLLSDRGVFSKRRLDEGTLLLLKTIANMDLGERILDLGCGLGPIGLILAAADPRRSVTCSDVNLRALELTRKNAELLGVSERVETVNSDLYHNLPSIYDAIITNPPIRAGKRVTYAIYEGARDHLAPGGRLYLVIRKKQGADSALAYIRALYKDARVIASHKGYRVISAGN